MGRPRIIDLSVDLVNNPPGSFIQSAITYHTHEEGATVRGKMFGLPEGFFPENRFAAEEEVTLSTHAGTHLDAPYHWGPLCEGKPAKTADQIPLEWCYSDGVVLDFTHKKAGDLITAEDVQQAVAGIDYKIKPLDIVLIRTDVSRHYGQPGYESKHPGMGRESTSWLIDQGVKVMGIDAWGWDRPMGVLIQEIKETGDKSVFWAGHFVGKEKEYCHLENLANLDKLPRPFGFKVAVFPVKIHRASSGWVRAVAILEE
jgi:kynurenine formamidase